MRAWWGEPETELGYIRDMIEGRDTTRPFIFSVDGEAVGYIQYLVHWRPPERDLDCGPSLARRVAVRRGRCSLRSAIPPSWPQGIGSAALRAFVQSAWSGKGHRTIVIDPDPDNSACRPRLRESRVRAPSKAA